MIKVLSLGAGVQSSTVLRLAIHGEIERPDHVIFADTGWEPLEVYDHLEVLEMEMRKAGLDFHVVESGNIRIDHVRGSGENANNYNPPSLPFFTLGPSGAGMTPRQCTSSYKIQPIEKKIKELVSIGRKSKTNHVPKVEHWFGISTDELRRTRLSKNWWSVNYYPLIDLHMSRDDCHLWLREHGYPEAPRSCLLYTSPSPRDRS